MTSVQLPVQLVIKKNSLTSSGIFMYTSTNLSPHRSRTVSRSLRYGEMNDISVIMPLSAKSLPTSPMRRMFSSRSSGENPRLELRPWRMLSPSSTCAILPRWKSACSRVYATVD